MDARKLKAFVAVFLCATMSLASCGFSDYDEDDEDENVNASSKGGMLGRAEEQVALVRNEVDWNKAKEYRSNAEYTIGKLKSPTQRRNLTSLLNTNYCHSMDTIMQMIMAGECSSQHGLLNELYDLRTGKEYGEIDKNSMLHEQVMKSYDKHKKILALISSTKTAQPNIKSWNTSYDEQTENNKKREAKAYLETGPTCKSIITGLKNIQNGAAFKDRRKDYCGKIFELYVQKESWSPQDERVLNGLLNSTFIDSYPNDPEVAIWKEKIKEFKSSHQ